MKEKKVKRAFLATFCPTARIVVETGDTVPDKEEIVRLAAERIARNPMNYLCWETASVLEDAMFDLK